MNEKLSAPFPPESISWRAQGLYGTKAMALAYIDARDVMARLDDVCGIYGWQDSYTETPRGRVICTIKIESGEGKWIAKSDGAGDTDVEGDKGAISDAFKRAAVKWGIGRYLYDLPTVWAPCEVQERNGKNAWKKWLPEAQKVFSDALRGVAQDDTKKPAHSALQADVKAFVREMESCGDWDEWVCLRETASTKALLKDLQDKLPQWWDGGADMPKDFVPLRRRIEILEANFANNIADIARA